MSNAKAYHQQVKEAFSDPSSKDLVGHSGAWGLGILETPLGRGEKKSSSRATLERTLPSIPDH